MLSHNKIIIGIIIIIILLLMYFVFYSNIFSKNDNGDFIEGLWQGDPEFCTKAGTDSMIIYIGEKENGNDRNAYIILTQGDKMIQKKFIATILNNTFKSKEHEDSEDDIEDFENDIKSEANIRDIIPPKLNMELNINKGTLKLHDGETLWGKLWKDNSSSF